ncbi:methyltransferase [Gallaecimonas sp. GXIMD4217]|uniref:methyltransferase n=1 Tax=Gallaecimonas sp. GXIMD4217 TaxID=3131927 RepID=UPI00311B3624
MHLPTSHLGSLDRFPPRDNDPLQAWDAADLYLLSSVTAAGLDPQRPVLILNDHFGALTTALADFPVTSVSDSQISHLAMAHNLAKLGLSGPTMVDNLADWPQRPQLVLIQLPKQLSLLEYQLAMLKPLLADDSLVLAAGRDRDIPERAEKMLAKYIGATDRCLGWKKCRLFVSQRDDKAPLPMPRPQSWPLEGTAFTLTNHANVFSRQSLDIGARLMLEHLPQGHFGRVIDLGCGNGVLALGLAARYPDCHYTLVDESHFAVASARDNFAANLPDVAVECIANDCLSGFKAKSADLVLCNPPFHQQQAVTDHIAWQMMKDAHRVLRVGGELRLVGNRHLGYHLKLKRLFGGCTVVASNRKFVILSAKKRK